MVGNDARTARVCDHNVVKLALDSAKLKAPVTARWFDRTSGEFKSVEGSPIANIGTRKFTPRRQNAAGEDDWVQFFH